MLEAMLIIGPILVVFGVFFWRLEVSIERDLSRFDRDPDDRPDRTAQRAEPSADTLPATPVANDFDLTISGKAARRQREAA